jgi:hypothetical protein
MSATLAPPPAATPPQETPTKADAFVVSCIDPRTTGGVAALLAALGREDRYSELRVAGAALAALDPASPAATVLWENLAASRKLHGIRKVTFLNHRDCGAMHIWAGRRLADDPMEEQRRHTEVLTRAAEEVRRRHPDLLVELKLMNLDGTTQVIPCAACIPAGFQPSSVGPAAQLLADVPPEGMVLSPSRMQGTQPDPQGFAALVRVRAEGPPLSAAAELSLLSEGITRYGLTARTAQEVSGSVLATLRPAGAGATRDVREVLRTRADAAGRIGQQDVRAAARLYRRLTGPGTSHLESERRAAALAEEEGLVPRPKGPWPFRSTRWFRTLVQPAPQAPRRPMA